MVILLRGKEYFNRVSPWLFYCETRRISRGRLYGFGFRGEENFKRTAICFFFIARRVDFQERTSMALYVGRKEFQEGACMVFDCQARRISSMRRRLHGYLSLIHLCFKLFVI